MVNVAVIDVAYTVYTLTHPDYLHCRAKRSSYNISLIQALCSEAAACVDALLTAELFVVFFSNFGSASSAEGMPAVFSGLPRVRILAVSL